MDKTSVLLLRHSPAGDRSDWVGDDRLRPLDRKGSRQAVDLVETLGSYPIKRILSSPYVRCLQTVEPLARKLGLVVEEVATLGEGHTRKQVLAALESVTGDLTLACTHGDIMEEMVGVGQPMKKGGTWLLDPELSPVEYVPPPRKK